MALVVFRALFSRRFWEKKDPPVADATDDTARGENDVAGCAGDSVGGVRSRW